MSSNPPLDSEARAVAREILRQHRVAVIATSVADDPWASTVFYAEADFILYVNTPTPTTMPRNLRANPRVSYAVDSREPSLFLQATGRATVVEDPAELAQAREILAIKVPEAHVGAAGYTLVRIETAIVYVSDFREGYRPRARIDIFTL